MVQRFSVAIQAGNSRIFDRVAQYNRAKGLQAPNRRQRVRIPQPRRSPVPPSARISIPISDPAPAAAAASGFSDVEIDPAALSHVHAPFGLSDIESPSEPQMSEQTEPSDEPEPSDREIESMASHAVNWGRFDAESAHSDDSSDDEIIGFAGEGISANSTRIVLGGARRRSRRR